MSILDSVLTSLSRIPDAPRATREYFQEHTLNDGFELTANNTDRFLQAHHAPNWVQGLSGSVLSTGQLLWGIPTGLRDMARVAVDASPRGWQHTVGSVGSFVVHGMVQGVRSIAGSVSNWGSGSLNERNSFRIAREVTLTAGAAGLMLMGAKNMARGGGNLFNAARAGLQNAAELSFNPATATAAVASTVATIPASGLPELGVGILMSSANRPVLSTAPEDVVSIPGGRYVRGSRGQGIVLPFIGLAAVAIVASSCDCEDHEKNGDGSTGPDSGVNPPLVDSGTLDGGTLDDAGVVLDAGYPVDGDSTVYSDAGISPDAGIARDAVVLDAGPISPSCDPDGDGIITSNFTDPNLLNAIRLALGRGPTEDITTHDALTTTSLALARQNILNLAGIECFTNLSFLNLGGNRISNLTPLSELISLRSLELFQNQISDITPLSSLVILTNLGVDTNQISNLAPLSFLTNLGHLNVSSNQIVDIAPLSGLRHLGQLMASDNQISDLTPLTGHRELTSLMIGGNRISNLAPLSSTTLLQDLQISQNQISDISALSSLPILRTVGLSRNQIVDISALASLRVLVELDLDVNRISDLSPLSSVISLTRLTLNHNQIESVTALSALIALNYLDLGQNRISDITPLIDNSGLGTGDYCNLNSNRPISPSQVASLRARGVSVDWP